MSGFGIVYFVNLVVFCFRLWSHCSEDRLGTCCDNALRHHRDSVDSTDDNEPRWLHGHRLPLPLQEHLLRPLLPLLPLLFLVLLETPPAPKTPTIARNRCRREGSVRWGPRCSEGQATEEAVDPAPETEPVGVRLPGAGDGRVAGSGPGGGVATGKTASCFRYGRHKDCDGSDLCQSSAHHRVHRPRSAALYALGEGVDLPDRLLLLFHHA